MTRIILYAGRRVLPAALLLLCFCAEKDGVIRQKLDVILKDDLEAILEDVDTAALLDTPYFDLLEYREYDEGAYSRMAIVDFHFLKPFAGKGAKISRKYRYHKRLGLWDRYHNKYHITGLEAEETGGAPQPASGEREPGSEPKTAPEANETEKEK